MHQTDRPNTLGGMGSALYEPIHRQGTKNPRGDVGCMDGELFNQTPELNHHRYGYGKILWILEKQRELL